MDLQIPWVVLISQEDDAMWGSQWEGTPGNQRGTVLVSLLSNKSENEFWLDDCLGIYPNLC